MFIYSGTPLIQGDSAHGRRYKKGEGNAEARRSCPEDTPRAAAAPLPRHLMYLLIWRFPKTRVPFLESLCENHGNFIFVSALGPFFADTTQKAWILYTTVSKGHLITI